MRPLLTVTALCYQEIQCIRGWLENMLRFADRILISEGGSTDGTREVISEYQQVHGDRIVVVPFEQSHNPHHDNYSEGLRRNILLDMVTEGYVVRLDIDEMLQDDFRERVTPFLRPDTSLVATWLNFWRSPRMIRVGTPKDANWGPTSRDLVFPAGTTRFSEAPVHAHPDIKTKVVAVPELKIFHYHYLFAYPKKKENRFGEWTGAWHPDIALKVYSGAHPEALKFLSDTINFSELAAINSEETLAKYSR